ncbi:MAG: phage portal protein [Lachnospiraceae bacterium]|nr:phage portal protein [Lachnospiraceae bacterium]
METEPVKICINKIAELVSNMTIYLMQNTDKGNIRIKDEVSRMLDIYPNPIMTRKTFIFNIVRDLCKTGNAVIMPEVNKDGKITALKYWRPADYMFTNQTADSYIIEKNGQPFMPDTVCHCVLFPDETYPYMGTGFKPLVKETVATICQENATKNAFLSSKYQPPMIVSVNADIDKFQTPEGRKEILDSYISETEQGKPWVIPAGEIDVKSVAPLTLNDLAVNDGIELDLKRVAAAFGMPGFVVGIGQFDKDEYNHFISTTIMSIALAVQQELSRKLFAEPTYFCKFNARSLMHYSLEELTTFVKEMVSIGIESRNEGREEFDLSPVDDEGMDERTVLENFIPVYATGMQKKLKGGEDADED